MKIWLINNRNKYFTFLALLFCCSTVFAQPGISSFTPLSGRIGTTVTITGINFSTIPANNIVYFGKTRAVVATASVNSLAVSVPFGTTYHPISVTVNGRTAYSRLPFTVTFTGGNIYDSAFGQRIDTLLANGEWSYGSALADLDTDGKPDIIVSATNNNMISVFRNTSSGGTIQLAAKQNIPAGNKPQQIITGDIDGDGRLDIVTTNINDSSISIFRNTSTAGNISFAARDSIRTGPSPDNCAIGDIDGDGRPDIVYRDATQSSPNSYAVYVLRNTSVGGILSFAPRIILATESGYRLGGIVIADLNSDGKADLAVGAGHYVSFNYMVSVFRNTSIPDNISFATRQDIANEGKAIQLTASDISGDGLIDLVTANESALYDRVLINTGTGGNISFSYKQFTHQGTGMTSAVADLDGDSKPDILEGSNNLYNGVKVYKNTSVPGDVSVAYMASFPADTTMDYPRGLSVGDLDGDSLPDIVFVRYYKLVIYKNRATSPGIFSFTPTSAVTGTTVAISGYNLSNTTAVNFGGTPASSFTVQSANSITAVVAAGSNNGYVGVTNSSGTGVRIGFTFEPPIIDSFMPATGPVGSIVTIRGSKFNPVAQNNTVLFGAAKAPVISATDTSLTVSVPAGTTFQPISVSNRNLVAYSAKPFLVSFAGGENGFTANSFNPRVDFVTGFNGASCRDVAMADLDGDGKGDIVTSTGISKTIGLHLNTSTPGNISFAAWTYITRPDFVYYPGSLIVSDFDGDGKPDILAASAYSAPANQNSTVWIYRNACTPGVLSFVESRTPSNFNIVDIWGIALADVDRDGRPDIVVSSIATNSKSIRTFLNRSTPGNILFEYGTDNVTLGSNMQVAVADFDGNGKIDFALNNRDVSSVSAFRNNNTIPGGTVNFFARTDVSSGTSPVDITAADFDGDNKPDMAAVNYNSSNFSVYRNTSSASTITFNPKQDFAGGTTPQTIVPGDLNGDGKVDLVIQSSTTDSCRLMRNSSSIGTISFSNDLLFNNIPGQNAGITGDVDGDGKPDMILCGDGGPGIPAKFSVFRNRIGEPDTVSVCPGGNSSMVAGLLGTSWQWQLDAGSGFVDISDNANYSGTSSNTLLLTNIPSSWNTYRYRCVVNGVNGPVQQLKFTNTWTGGSGNAWENPANWSCGSVPDAFTSVIINTGTVVVNANTTIWNLALGAGGNVTVATGVQLTIQH